MANFAFDKCCFCIDLRVGYFIIAYLKLIPAVLVTIVSLIAFRIILNMVRPSNVYNTDLLLLPPYFIAPIIAIIVAATLFFILIIIFPVVLLVGLFKSQPGHVNAFLIYSYIVLAIAFSLVISFPIECFGSSSMIVILIVNLLFEMYLVMVIRSYYHQMLKDSARAALITS